MIRATKCKLKQMGPKYFSSSFSLLHLCQVSDLAVQPSIKTATFLLGVQDFEKK